MAQNGVPFVRTLITIVVQDHEFAAWRDSRLHSVAEATHALNDLREQWLSPPHASQAELKKSIKLVIPTKPTQT